MLSAHENIHHGLNHACLQVLLRSSDQDALTFFNMSTEMTCTGVSSKNPGEGGEGQGSNGSTSPRRPRERWSVGSAKDAIARSASRGSSGSVGRLDSRRQSDVTADMTWAVEQHKQLLLEAREELQKVRSIRLAAEARCKQLEAAEDRCTRLEAAVRDRSEEAKAAEERCVLLEANEARCVQLEKEVAQLRQLLETKTSEESVAEEE